MVGLTSLIPKWCSLQAKRKASPFGLGFFVSYGFNRNMMGLAWLIPKISHPANKSANCLVAILHLFTKKTLE